MTVHRIETQANGLSTAFDDYSDEARDKYEGTHMRIECHVPIEFAKVIRIGEAITIEVSE